MAAQSCTFSMDVNVEREPNFGGQNPSFWYWHSMMNTFSGNSGSDEKTGDHNWLLWEDQCNQQLDQFLKLTPLLQVNLVTWRSLPVVAVSKVCLASWLGGSGSPCSEPYLYIWPSVGSVLLPHDIDFHSDHTPHFSLQYLSLPGCRQWTRHTFKSHFWQNFLFSAKFAFRILYCVWISIIITEMKIAEKRSKLIIKKIQSSRQLTTSSWQSVANPHKVFKVICNAFWVKQQIFP